MGAISRVDEAMAYSALAGGKRLRPILLMAAADAVGGKGTDFLPLASALEMIHTYSLIHDDLPEMDNDDYRRGRLTNHKVFGQAMAVLAGDGLLTQAFEVMTEQKGVDPALMVEIIHLIARCAGPEGMVGGQALDINAEEKHLEPAEMKQLHEAKTGALFIAAIRSGPFWAAAARMKSMPLRNLPPFSDLPSKLRMISSTWKGTAKSWGKWLEWMKRCTNPLTSVFLPWKEPKPWPLIP